MSTSTRLSFGLVVAPSSETLARFEELADWIRESASLKLIEERARAANLTLTVEAPDDILL